MELGKRSSPTAADGADSTTVGTCVADRTRYIWGRTIRARNAGVLFATAAGTVRAHARTQSRGKQNGSHKRSCVRESLAGARTRTDSPTAAFPVGQGGWPQSQLRDRDTKDNSKPSHYASPFACRKTCIAKSYWQTSTSIWSSGHHFVSLKQAPNVSQSTFSPPACTCSRNAIHFR